MENASQFFLMLQYFFKYWNIGLLAIFNNNAQTSAELQSFSPEFQAISISMSPQTRQFIRHTKCELKTKSPIKKNRKNFHLNTLLNGWM